MVTVNVDMSPPDAEWYAVEIEWAEHNGLQDYADHVRDCQERDAWPDDVIDWR